MKILFLESFFGGSHRDFVLGLKEYSRHKIDILSLPAKNWKWRMRGSALYFIQQIKTIDEYDLIFVTDMINLSDFMALLPVVSTPVIFYFHENQLTYPLTPDKKKRQGADLQFGYTNITSALGATKILFNSQFQLNEFILKIDKLIEIAPDFKLPWIKKNILGKSKVLYPGCRFSGTSPEFVKEKSFNPEVPLIIWNHRWEWDKNPQDFFAVLRKLKEKKVPFKLALVGEIYGEIPKIFRDAQLEFRDEITSFGYIESKKDYMSLLHKGSIVISTAIQENFGISVVEAVRMGCIPLLPDRLSYPEIMPEKYFDKILYSDEIDFFMKLEDMLLNYSEYFALKEQLSTCMEKYSWEVLIKEYDREFERVVGEANEQVTKKSVFNN